MAEDLRTLIDDSALMVHDPGYAEITVRQWVRFMASASMDARNAGWLMDYEDDETIEVVAATYNYAVPLPFAYIDGIIISERDNETFVDPVPNNHWGIRLNDGVPQFAFATISYLSPGSTLKIVGQKRPTIYTSLDEPVDAGMESFLRERAMYFAFRYMGAGSSELAGWRRTMSTQSFQTSEAFLHRHPKEFRQHPSSTLVPGRG